MAISYEAVVVGDVRADSISATPGFGALRLQFTLVWALHPKRGDTYTVFGTYLRVSVAPPGEAYSPFLGHAWPEVAWSQESRHGISIDQTVMYHLGLHANQLLALEKERHGRELVFTLELRGNVNGPHGIRQIDQTLQLRASISDWTRVLHEASAAEYLLIGIRLPLDSPSPEFVATVSLLRRANDFLIRGEYDSAVGECRRAIESIWKAGKLQEIAHDARKALSGAENTRRPMSKQQRELAIGEALINFTHPAHHVGHGGDPEIFSRQDAVLAIATTAGLISSLGRISLLPGCLDRERTGPED